MNRKRNKVTKEKGRRKEIKKWKKESGKKEKINKERTISEINRD